MARSEFRSSIRDSFAPIAFSCGWKNVLFGEYCAYIGCLTSPKVPRIRDKRRRPTTSNNCRCSGKTTNIWISFLAEIDAAIGWVETFELPLFDARDGPSHEQMIARSVFLLSHRVTLLPADERRSTPRCAGFGYGDAELARSVWKRWIERAWPAPEMIQRNWRGAVFWLAGAVAVISFSLYDDPAAGIHLI